MEKVCPMPLAHTIEPHEIAHFSKDAGKWWDPEGPFKPLHRLNPVRLQYVRQTIAQHFKRDVSKRACLSGLAYADIGCGGGLMAEPMARMGAHVTAIDASAEAVAAAQEHAAAFGLKINYKLSSVEELAATGRKFDVVAALEIVEHVRDVPVFLTALRALLKPGGLLLLSTLNRTPRSFLLGIVAAEYILGWVPRGTHDWRKFIKPAELAEQMADLGLRAEPPVGIIFNPFRGEFALSERDVEVNYLMAARAKAG